MENIRSIKKLTHGLNAVDGAGVRLTRVFGNQDAYQFDPFLMLDAFDSTNPQDYIKGFPWHPHRGIETVTYLIEGRIEHQDSLGNKGVIGSGECQWMTAGSGILHTEMPKESKRMLGVQLWVNLASRDKMTPPKYRDIKATDIPLVEDAGAQVRLIAGNYKGKTGPVEGINVNPVLMDVSIKPGEELQISTEEGSTVFAFIIEGDASFGPGEGEAVESKTAVLFDEGKFIKAKAGEAGVRFLLAEGRPLKEPIAWGGPIVMNTKEELKKAFAELDNGTFIK